MQQTAIRINWSRVFLRCAQVMVVCAMLSAFSILMWPHTRYLFQLAYSLCIAVPYMLVIEFGSLLVSREHRFHNTQNGSYGWPKGWRGLALAAAGIAAAFLGGTQLAMWLLGRILALMPTLVLTITGGVLVSFYFYVRDAQSTLQAEAARAERDATQARLMLLQSQLEPHMLFNTLANLRALIGNDPTAARHMLDLIDGFLRTSLSASRATVHPLATEFERLYDYLALMSIRMGPRLSYALHLPQELGAQPVPPLLLQPLVENAIKHGLEPRVEGGRVEVRAACEDQQLVLTVHDTGVGFDFNLDTSKPDNGEHFGLQQVFERVVSAYGNDGRVHVHSTPGEGSIVYITLPLASVSSPEQ